MHALQPCCTLSPSAAVLLCSVLGLLDVLIHPAVMLCPFGAAAVLVYAPPVVMHVLLNPAVPLYPAGLVYPALFIVLLH